MAEGSEAVVAGSPELVLMIERIFDAPRELVFKCWTEPEHFARWIGPQGFRSTILVWELRQGGNYLIHKRGPDGQEHGSRVFSRKSFRRENCADLLLGGC